MREIDGSSFSMEQRLASRNMVGRAYAIRPYGDVIRMVRKISTAAIIMLMLATVLVLLPAPPVEAG